jgi:hypothetical protein
MPPTVTALCAPNTAEYAWSVSSNEALSNYDVLVSFSAGATFDVGESSATQPYTFDTARPGGIGSSYGEVVNLEWHDDPGIGMSTPANSDPYPCVTPALKVTTECAFANALPDGNVSFGGGVEGMLFDVYGPEAHGSFPSEGPIGTADGGTGVGYGSMNAGSYEFAYVAPGSKPTIDGSFTVGTCPPGGG